MKRVGTEEMLRILKENKIDAVRLPNGGIGLAGLKLPRSETLHAILVKAEERADCSAATMKWLVAKCYQVPAFIVRVAEERMPEELRAIMPESTGLPSGYSVAVMIGP